jgi:hypothetical protein
VTEVGSKRGGDWGVSLACAAFTFCFGPFFQPVLFQVWKHHAYGPVNIVWNPVYGIGYRIVELLFNFHSEPSGSKPLALFGFLLWPLIVFGLVFQMSRWIVRGSWPRRYKILVLALFVLTFFLNVSSQQAAKLDWLPFWDKYYASMY